jgi:hypothetical protein
MSTQNQVVVAPTIAELQAEIVRLKAAAKRKAETTNGFRCTDKGGVSVYGLHPKYPTTLSIKQWDLFAKRYEGLKAFIEANRPKLEAAYAAHRLANPIVKAEEVSE